MGKEPEAKQTRPQEGIVSEDGAFGAGRLVVNQAVGRVDIAVTAAPVLNWPTIGKMEDAYQSLFQLLQPHLSYFRSSFRVGVGGAATVRTNSRKESYEILQELLPDFNIRPEARDLFVQLNYPRTLRSVPEMQVNRLGKWFSGVIGVAPMHLIATGGSSVSLGEMVRCETDVNTAPDKKLALVDDKALDSLLAELKDLSIELLYEGAQP
ncbi:MULTISPECIES: hypothetical protein [unclassified Burkholderia]|uniref:hypothetical protein n=1 Tax=unclassified Burkholderia TaxID=2613784 RepID=UPI002AB0B976|nr:MULTISPECIES: hypothetical protein [unclassified Burkholderia]